MGRYVDVEGKESRPRLSQGLSLRDGQLKGQGHDPRAYRPSWPEPLAPVWELAPWRQWDQLILSPSAQHPLSSLDWGSSTLTDFSEYPHILPFTRFLA